MAILSFLAAEIHAQGIIDVHCHNITPSYLEALEKHDAALEEGFPLPSWNLDAHIKFMNSAGISRSILSMPAPQPFFGNRDECAKTIRAYNEYCANLKQSQPDRFGFCASLPLPDVNAAIAEAIYALDTLKADGIKLATNSRGQYLGEQELEPLMEILNKRKAVIILHPHKPDPVNERLMEALPLACYEYPAETTRAILNILAQNLLVRYKDLKIIVPHCGSFLPLAIPRLKAIIPVMQSKGLLGEIDIEENLSRLYYDLAGAASPEIIKSMLSITSPEHILYGSDYPYQPAGLLTKKRMELEDELMADKELSTYKELLLWGNAAKLFPHK